MSLLRGMRLVFCGLALACAQATLAAPADDIKALIDKGDSKSAYELGKKYPDQLGEPAFDFYFGVAAIDSGHAGEGVLALERYMINFPDNHNARLELARGGRTVGRPLRARCRRAHGRRVELPARASPANTAVALCAHRWW